MNSDATRREWRELGFFYAVNSELHEWIIQGDRAGLIKFSELLNSYSLNPVHTALSEHDHFGPYMDLKIVTWSSPDITEHDIRGRLKDIKHLGDLLRRVVSRTAAGCEVVIRDEFAPTAEYSIRIKVAPDGFDPASADPLLTK